MNDKVSDMYKDAELKVDEMNTTGGVEGTWIQIVAIAANKYMVTGVVNGSGTVATPFADS